MTESKSEITVVGHRGCAGLYPENSLEALEHAFKMGVDAVEFDVHLTKDGHVIVYHDFFLNPNITMDDKGEWIERPKIPLHEMTLEQIKKYRIGNIKPGTKYAKKHSETQNTELSPIPTLQDVFDLASKYKNVILEIEIKTNPETPEISSEPMALTDAVMTLIRQYRYEKRTAIVAFDWRVLKQVRKINPDMPTFFCYMSKFKKTTFNPIWLGGEDLKDYGNSPIEMVAAYGGDYWSVNFAELTPHLIKEAHKKGVKVNAWTPNAKEEMLKLIRDGVDSITTDRPDILFEITQHQ